MGGYAQKVQSGAMMKSYPSKNGSTKMYKVTLADAGTPDVLACFNGVFLGIEVKKDAKEVEKWYKQKDERSQRQMEQALLIGKAGGYALVVSSLDEFISDWEDVSQRVSGQGTAKSEMPASQNHQPSQLPL